MNQLHAIRARLNRLPRRFAGDASHRGGAIHLCLSLCGLLFGFAVLCFAPATASAQVAGVGGRTAAADTYTISLRDLSIPPEAREALLEGNRLMASYDFAGGMAQFRRAIAKYPAYYEAYFYLGVAEMNLHRGLEAEAAFRRSVELSNGAYAPAHFGLGLVLCEQKRFEEAGATIGIGLYLDGESGSGYYAMGRAFYGMNRLEDAERSAREGIARKSDLKEAYLLLADIHGRQQNQSAVLEDLDNYIELDSDSVTRQKAQDLRDSIQRTLSLESSDLISEP